VIVDELTRRTLAATTRFGDIRELAEVDSTNRYLLDLARGGAPEGVVVVADFQSAGRGRLGRSWEAPPGGGLLVSILLRPDTVEVPPGRRWLVIGAVALAAADACRQVAGVAPDIKWPNDLLLGDRKLAGILAEADAGAIVVGVGINVASAPPGAASLGPSVDRGQLLAGLLSNLEFWCQDGNLVEAAYRDRCATVGRRVRVSLPGGRTVVGRAVAVDPDGRLCVVAGGEEVLHLSAGDVLHVTDP
jgi:BirA family transcriptional regulator, biotin operon repressor / biotin---[acetyl-CoA-carboxylase] ligase